MGYFAETMALFETKSEAKLAYYDKASAERFTHNHDEGKEFGKEYSSTSFRRYQPMRNKSDYEQRELMAKMHKMSYDYDERKRKRNKSCKESFEDAFASVIL